MNIYLITREDNQFLKENEIETIKQITNRPDIIQNIKINYNSSGNMQHCLIIQDNELYESDLHELTYFNYTVLDLTDC